MRAIWQSWATGEPLRFEGEFYRHTLMTPFFNPGANPFGNPPVILAGVGPSDDQNCRRGGRRVLLARLHHAAIPAGGDVARLAGGRAAAGKDDFDGFEMCGMPFIVTGVDDDGLRAAVAATRKQIAFYGSTPAYRPVLDLHGWGDLGLELNRMSKLGEWDAMGELITDEMVREIAIVAAPDQVATRLLAEYGDIFTRTGFYAPYAVPEGFWESDQS